MNALPLEGQASSSTGCPGGIMQAPLFSEQPGLTIAVSSTLDQKPLKLPPSLNYPISLLSHGPMIILFLKYINIPN